MKKASPIAHSDLVVLAARWLRRRYPIVITEIASAALEAPDALGVSSWGGTTLIECKASRADFLADAKKRFRRDPDIGMGIHRYYLCPAGMIGASELPKGWGLLYVTENRRGVYQKVKAAPQERSAEAEQSVLVSILRRIGQEAPQGVSIKCYTISTLNRAALYLRV